MKLFYKLLILLFVATGCQSKVISEDEKQLDLYFSEKHKLNLQDYKNYIIVVISGNCGSCTDKTIKFLKNLGDKKNSKFNNINKIVVIPDNNAYVIDSLQKSDLKFYIDKTFELQKFGINFDKNTFFEFKDNTLVFQDVLYLNNVDTVAKKYGFTL